MSRVDIEIRNLNELSLEVCLSIVLVDPFQSIFHMRMDFEPSWDACCQIYLGA